MNQMKLSNGKKAQIRSRIRSNTCSPQLLPAMQPSLTFSWYWRLDESRDWIRAVAWPMNMA